MSATMAVQSRRNPVSTEKSRIMREWSSGDIHRTLQAKIEQQRQAQETLERLNRDIAAMSTELSLRLRREIQARHQATGDTLDPLVARSELGAYF